MKFLRLLNAYFFFTDGDGGGKRRLWSPTVLFIQDWGATGQNIKIIKMLTFSYLYYKQRLVSEVQTWNALALQLTVNDKSQNLRRLQAQRNELNAKGNYICPPPENEHLPFLHDFQPKTSMPTSFLMSFLVRLLREELQLLQEQGSYVGEVVRVMDKKKVLVKVCQLPFSVNAIFTTLK